MSTAFQFSYIHAFPTSKLQAACHSAYGVSGLPFREASPPPGLRKKTRFISGIRTQPTLAKHSTLRYQRHVWGHQRGTADLLQKDSGTCPRSLKKFVAEQRMSATSLGHLHPQKWVECSVLSHVTNVLYKRSAARLPTENIILALINRGAVITSSVSVGGKARG